MPIEFDCPQCGNRLRTPDGTEGRTAKCPGCSSHVPIPAQANAPADDVYRPEPATSPPPPQPGQDRAGFNPYSAPSADTSLPDEGPISDLTPTRVTASQIYSTCWQTFRNNLMHFFLLGLVLIAFQIGGQIVSLPLGLLAGVAAEAESIAGIVVIQIVNIVWSQILGTFCSAIAIRYCLSVTAGDPEPMKGAFNVFPVFLRLFFAQILVALLVYAGAFLIFVPFLVVAFLVQNEVATIVVGVGTVVAAFVFLFYIWTRLLLTFSFIIDRNQGIFDSMASSFAYSKGNSGAIFWSLMGIGFLSVLFMIFTCFIGTILAWPYLLMSIVVVYRLVTGQSIGGKSPFSQGAPPSAIPPAPPGNPYQ